MPSCSAVAAWFAFAVLAGGCASRAGETVEPAAPVPDASTFRFSIEYESGGVRSSAGGGTVDRGGRVGTSTLVAYTPWIAGVGAAHVTARTISTRRAFYRSTTFSHPSLRPKLAGAKPWIEGPRDPDLLHAMGIGEAVAPVDAPGTLLAWLRKVADPAAVSTEVVRGVQTTRWHARVDLRDVARLARGHTREVARGELFGYLEEGIEPMVDVDVWAGEDGVARRVRVDEGGAMTVEYFDFGAPIAVRPPAPGQAMTDAELTAIVERQCARRTAPKPPRLPSAQVCAHVGPPASTTERVE